MNSPAQDVSALDLIRRLHQHRAWANHRAMSAAGKVSESQLLESHPIGQGTVLQTLTHLYGAEFVWLAAIEGDPSPRSPFAIRMNSLAELSAAWKALDARWQRFIDTLTEADLSRTIVKRSSLDPDGPPMRTPLSDVLLHIATHAQYTLAQFTNMLRRMNVKPLPDFMLITLSRQETAEREKGSQVQSPLGSAGFGT